MTETQKEEQYLETLIKKVAGSLTEINELVHKKKEEIDEMHLIMQENKRDMDHLDKNALREAIHNQSLIGEHGLDKRKRLARLLDVPYFGRLDFVPEKSGNAMPIYVGVHNYLDEESRTNLVYDWRSPISSMFYDFETGRANYPATEEIVEGDIVLKRQFRIRRGKMEYMLDSDLTIHDDVLQRELNQASSSKMKNIVATIQREQNAIIRNEEARHLVIQGVAGSGKTSIALHRIAFLLYKFKDTISSDDILIISPNKVFASYISNVLPELGEETVAETSMEDIANEVLEYKINFQTFFQQVSELLEKTDEKLIERILFKSAPEMVKKLDQYLLYLENEGLNVQDIFVKNKLIPGWFIKESFQKFHRFPILKRFNEVVQHLVNSTAAQYKIEIMGSDRTALQKQVRSMFPSTSLRVLYKGFYEWLGQPELLKLRKGSTYEFSDVYPLVYLKMKLEGLLPYRKVKHLVVDEMQDYSAVQYRVLNALYPCKKTILGDINQSVNPFSSSSMDSIRSLFAGAVCMTMLKSYRSTYEITEFTKRVSQKVEVEAIERHGEEPTITAFKQEKEELAHLKTLITQFRESDYNSLGIICKTQSQADELYKALHQVAPMHLLNATSASFNGGIVVTTAHLAKGLEFDWVLVPHCTEKNYHTDPDRQMLYVACTRAMHRLHLTHSASLTSFLRADA